jgi:hypothetical protein
MGQNAEFDFIGIYLAVGYLADELNICKRVEIVGKVDLV